LTCPLWRVFAAHRRAERSNGARNPAEGGFPPKRRRGKANLEGRVVIVQAARKAGTGDGRNQANALAEDFGSNQKRTGGDEFIERSGPDATYIDMMTSKVFAKPTASLRALPFFAMSNAKLTNVSSRKNYNNNLALLEHAALTFQ
jgi:hypothetical protein